MSMVRFMATAGLLATVLVSADASARAEPVIDRVGLPLSQPLPTVASLTTYQGQLTDSAGAPLTGSHNLVFQWWDDASAGAQLGTDIVRNGVTFDGGLFSVHLDVPAEVLDGRALWLRIGVDGQWLSPRQEVLPVPYAMGLRPGARIIGRSEDPVLTIAGQGVGSTAALSVTGIIGLEALGLTGVVGRGDTGVVGRGITGVRGVGGQGFGVHGVSYAASAVYGESEGGYGLEGFSRFSDGVHGQTSHGFAAGVSGAGPTGVFGSGAVVGVSGYAQADAATGVVGTADGENGLGVRGVAKGYGGTGVAGEAMYGTGVSGDGEVGVKGTSTVGWGIIAEGVTGLKAHGLQGDGISATSDGGDMMSAVRGSANNADGGHFTSGTGKGVAAYSSGTWLDGPAVYAENTSTNHGMAGVFKNTSDYHTAHFQNVGTGGVLFLINNGDANGVGGNDFITAVSRQAEAQFRVTSSGQVQSDVGFSTPAADFAELLPAVPGLEPGDLLAIGPDGRLVRSSRALQRNVAGVYATSPGFLGGAPLAESPDGTVPLTIVGVVPVKVSAENGAIRPGDLLVAASTPGRAMRAGDDPPAGTIVGKALGSLESGLGVIRMLATLQ